LTITYVLGGILSGIAPEINVNSAPIATPSVMSVLKSQLQDTVLSGLFKIVKHTVQGNLMTDHNNN
jgi:hypothetical protein